MSAALNLNTVNDASSQSLGRLEDLSLGSLPSMTLAPSKQRVASTSSGTTAPSSAPISTPSPPGMSYTRRKSSHNNANDLATPVGKRIAFSSFQINDDGVVDGEDGEDVLDTPGRERRFDALETPAASRPSGKRTKSSGGKGSSNLTLRDQEKHIDALKKENFNIKLKVHFLEERLAQLAPDQIDAALRQNINLKIEVQQRGLEMKRYKKLVLELERELERLQKARSRERELEEKLEERERELRELRRRGGAGPGMDREEETELMEVQLRNQELEERQGQLVEELDDAKELLEENMDEIERLKEIIQRRPDGSGDESRSDAEGGGSGRIDRMKRKIAELEEANEDLRTRLEDQLEVVAQREDEKEELADALEGVQLELEDLHRKREAESLERSQSRAEILEEREEREAVEEDLNALRDRLAATAIELQQKEDEIEMKSREIDELIGEHDRIVEVVEQEWRGEVDEARNQVEELRDAIAERDAESKELRFTISELESNTNELHIKFEAALAHLEQESEDKDAEIENANREIERLSSRVYDLEEEIDRLREDGARLREDEAAERERLETLSAALKDKLATVKDELQQMTEMYDDAMQNIHAHRARQEELARHVEDLVAECRKERDAREKAEADLDGAESRYETDLRHERRTLEAKESALQSALSDLARAQALLTQRERDLADVQDAIRALESESKKAGESHTTDRFSLQLEVDRLRRDIERVEADLTRARRDAEDQEAKVRDKEGALDRLHSENRDLSTQLAAQTQARLNVSDKLDSAQTSLRNAESELASYRSRVEDLENRLSKDQRSLLSAESKYRDQLTERNTLLLTIYQYTDKILGVDKTSKNAETKPFSNFGIFHDSLISRLKSLSQIQLTFDKKCKEAESRYTERILDLRKQLDSRWKQIDKFESSVKAMTETKLGWKRKFSSKEGELEALKTTNAELCAQLSNLKRPAQNESLEVKALQARAANAERRLTNAQNQLLATEEKMASMNQKTTAADNKWEARVKEYETRLKAAEERVKRERQGAKERVAELENTVKSLHRQIDLAKKRNEQLTDVVENNKISTSPNR
ncbi:hypothetical protein BD410DRAFT_792731 [Rickenella mellea]|uniref:Centrosomin N-terminal motif 1 domain-containing protein n=1 Tax=Rickenella mellea TaxID=50990 RepID=A0A4Y7PU49_9AGAM|nr:hypothetical protein BD410DRAFT_792731 [Rickenella mellea]